MFLFPFPTMIHEGYRQQRGVMVDWMVATCDCTDGNAQQVLTDIENHNGADGGGGVTELTVTIVAGPRTHDGKTIDGRSTISPAMAGGPFRVFHHSHGVIGTDATCTAFWIVQPGGLGLAKIVGLGTHSGADSYLIRWLAGAGFTMGRRGGVGPLPTVGSVCNPF